MSLKFNSRKSKRYLSLDMYSENWGVANRGSYDQYSSMLNFLCLAISRVAAKNTYSSAAVVSVHFLSRDFCAGDALIVT